MLIDHQSLGPHQTIDCEVCVVGAGPAGLTLALELARSGRDVVLVESGHLAPDARIQALGDAGSFPESRHAPMGMATQRRWGGTSTIWGGRCLPLDAVDFEARPARGSSVWPFGHAALSGYLAKACEYAVCGAPLFTVDDALGSGLPAIVPGFVDDDVTASSLERWSLPTNFGAVHAQEAKASQRLKAYLGLTCVSFAFSGARQMTGLKARSVDGVELEVTARQFVVAAGGLESTRLLMNCGEAHGGLGNHSGMLGRYYMGHISGKIAQVHFSTPARRTIYGFERDAAGVYCRRRFVVSPRVQREQALLNCAMWLDNPPLPDASHRNGILSSAYLALSTPVLSRRLAADGIRKAVLEHPQRSGWGPHVRNIVGDLPNTVRFIPPFLYRRYFAPRRIPGFFLFNSANRYALHYHGEQSPNESSQVRLSDSRDELGLRRLDIDFRYSGSDAESIIKSHEILDAQLRRQAVGQLVYTDDDLPGAIDRQAKDGYHQLGTTRMSARPEDGVVDQDCRVHHVNNLYVLSSSVFPTAGQANPTLTVVALALRLSEHLNDRLQGKK